MRRIEVDLSALAKCAGHTSTGAAWRAYVGVNAFGGPATSMGAASPAQVRGFIAWLRTDAAARGEDA